MNDLLPPGKVPWDVIAEKLSASLPPEVRLGPAVGEDAALVEIGNELWAVASDPITFTAADAGRLAVIVNAAMDALSDYNIRDLKMPLTPLSVWQAMQDSRKT